MKHPQYQKHRKYGVEWVQAMITLMVLIGIYMSSGYFDSYETSLTDSPAPPVAHSSPYWNEYLGYGFSGEQGTTYENRTTATSDEVTVRSGDGVVYDDSDIRVSFYSGVSIDDVEPHHLSDEPRTYSRLPNGIAVIEGNLASPTAKTILATLHSR